MELPLEALLLEKEKRARRIAAKRKQAEPPPDPSQWIENNFFIPEMIGRIIKPEDWAGRDPRAIELYPYQKAVLREAYRTDAEGHFIYSVIIWSDIKKSAKSSIAAAVALERAARLSYGSIKIVANDLKQADSRVAYYLRRALELNKTLGARTWTSRYTTKFDNGCTIEAIPVDPSGEAGGNDDLIIFSELWAAKHQAAKSMWTEMTLSPTKFGISQRWIETYAGYSGESPLLEQLHKSGVKEGKLIDLSFDDHDLRDLEVYANLTAGILCLWNTKPRLPWQTAEYYAQEAAVLQPDEFSRIHRNSWISSVRQFVPIEWWDACRQPIPVLDKYREIVVAIDAAVSNDCFAIIAMSRHENRTAVRYARKWTPPKGGKLEFRNHDDPTDVEYPEGELRRLAKEYNVICFTYDPYQLESFASDMRFEGVGMFEAFNQGAPRLISDKMWYDAIRDRLVLHSGEPDLREHIENSNSTSDEKDTLRIIKRSDDLKIDLNVAASMANAKAFEYLPD